MGGKEDKFDKFDKFDQYGQLAGGFDVNLAREAAVKHAREQLSKEKGWLRGVELEWEVETARFDEDDDCYKVVIEGYPDGAEVQEKAKWEYHIDAQGNMYAGTPRLVSRGKWSKEAQPGEKTKFCVYCGQTNSIGATFCRSCGKELPLTEEEKAELRRAEEERQRIEEEKQLAEERKRKEAEQAERRRIEEEKRQAEEQRRKEQQEAERKRMEAERKRREEEQRRLEAERQKEREKASAVPQAIEQRETPGSRKPILIIAGLLILIAAIIIPVVLLAGGTDEGDKTVASGPQTSTPVIATTKSPNPTPSPTPTCTSGWQCDGNTRYYLNSDCSKSSQESCQYGCANGECNEPPPSTLEMLSIPGGSFQMGNPDTSIEYTDDERPVHTVTLSPFEMAKYEVSYAEWIAAKNWAQSNGYSFDNPGGKGYGSGADEDHPVTTINWYDAVKWCNALSQKEGLTPCYYTSSAKTTVYRSGQQDIENTWVDWDASGYRLPTEAEWEYACRANTTTKYSFGNSIDGNDANYSDSGDSYDNGTTPVGSYSSNSWGLYDMHGNVWEWCWDWYGNYSSSSQTDPRGPSVGSLRVARGGSWYDSTVYLRSALRGRREPDLECISFGFRPVRSSS